MTEETYEQLRAAFLAQHPGAQVVLVCERCHLRAQPAHVCAQPALAPVAVDAEAKAMSVEVLEAELAAVKAELDAAKQPVPVVGLISGATPRLTMRERDPAAWQAWQRVEQWEFAQKLGVDKGLAFTDVFAVIRYLLRQLEAQDGPKIGMR